VNCLKFKIQDMGVSKLEQSLADGLHKRINEFEGKWAGNTKTWFDPAILADESPSEGSFKPLFDGRFMQFEYRSSMQGKPFEGIMIIGYHIKDNKLQMSWVDTFHMGTGIMLSEGEADGNNLSVTGYYGTGGEEPQTWGWRTTFEKNGSDELVIRAFNITPEGEESLATETIFKRVQ
jgi:hypothetical protein